MLKKKQSLPNSRIKLTITGDATAFRAGFEAELTALSKDLQVPGFRKGKVPRTAALERLGKMRVEAGTLDRMVSALYYDTIKSEKLVPVSQPTIEITEFTTPSDDAAADTEVVTFEVEVDVLPEVSVAGYEKIKLKKSDPEPVEDVEVDKVIGYLQKQRGSLGEAIEDGVVEDGMWADIGYEGQVGGVKRTDMANAHHPIVVGEGQLIPGFEEALLGMKVGESKTFPITFPKDYAATDLAGKKAEFTVTVHELKKVETPELDVEFAKAFGHDSAEALKAAIRTSLEEEKAEQAKGKQEAEAIEQLLKIAKFELPVSLVEQEQDRLFAEGKARLSQAPGQWEAYLERTGKTEEQVRNEVRETAEKNVRVGLALGQVVQEEKIPQSDTAGRQAVERLIELAHK